MLSQISHYIFLQRKYDVKQSWLQKKDHLQQKRKQLRDLKHKNKVFYVKSMLLKTKQKYFINHINDLHLDDMCAKENKTHTKILTKN